MCVCVKVGVGVGVGGVCAHVCILSPPNHLHPRGLTHAQGFIRLAVFLYSPAAASPEVSITDESKGGMLSWITESLKGTQTTKFQQDCSFIACFLWVPPATVHQGGTLPCSQATLRFYITAVEIKSVSCLGKEDLCKHV